MCIRDRDSPGAGLRATLFGNLSGRATAGAGFGRDSPAASGGAGGNWLFRGATDRGWPNRV